MKECQVYFSNYIPFLIYSIVRSEIWKKAFFLPVKHLSEKDSKTNTEKFNFFSSDELQINMYLSFAGKSKVFQNFTGFDLLRTFINKRQYDHLRTQMTFQEWWNSNNENEFLKILEDSLEKPK